ncbi:MAG TPA: sugar transferase [Solirubrobacteraceae bacterium]|nr:sugar transferase [Solirubrobacteraceae bacterium]
MTAGGLDGGNRKRELDAANGPPAGSYGLKRTLDLLIAVPAAIVSAPIVLCLCVLIRLESRGSPIFTQERAGLDGRPFRIFKLRTMVTGAEHVGAGLAVLQGDSRITRIGEFLRRTSLDELPNLWNVVRGEMSIVGPRPTLIGQVELYTERQRERLLVRPGISGWAQINGRASLPWSRRIELDIWYVEHLSLRLDLRILAMTVRMVFGGQGLYHADASGGVDLGPSAPTDADG